MCYTYMLNKYIILDKTLEFEKRIDTFFDHPDIPVFPRIWKRRGILFSILLLIFFLEVQPAKRHGVLLQPANSKQKFIIYQL